MAKERKPVPPKKANQVLVANKHTCCICREGYKPVQIHHIDGNPSNDDPANLAVLCTVHHTLVTAKYESARQFTPEAVRMYKEQWEEHCKLSDNKRIIINNTLNLTVQRPELDKKRIISHFISDVRSGVTPSGVTASVNSTGDMIQRFTGGKFTAKDFIDFILEGTDLPDEE